MKGITNLVGICLIVLGIVSLGYQGITYTKHEKVAQIGNVQVTADTQEHIYFSPLVGGACLLAGLVLVVVARKRP